MKRIEFSRLWPIVGKSTLTVMNNLDCYQSYIFQIGFSVQLSLYTFSSELIINRDKETHIHVPKKKATYPRNPKHLHHLTSSFLRMGMRRYMTYNGMYNVPVYTLFGIFTVLIKDIWLPCRFSMKCTLMINHWSSSECMWLRIFLLQTIDKQNQIFWFSFISRYQIKQDKKSIQF